MPKQLTAKDLEELESAGLIIDYEHFESLEDAEAFIEALSRGISDREIELYTQIDSDGETTYLKGKHVVNRTGVYLVVWR